MISSCHLCDAPAFAIPTGAGRMGRALSSRCSTKARFSPRDRVLHGGFWELPDWMISGKPFKTHHWRPWEWSDESNEMIKVHLLTDLLSFKNTKQNIVQTSTMVDIKFYSKMEPFLALTWPNVIPCRWWLTCKESYFLVWWCPSASQRQIWIFMNCPRCSELKSL